MISDHKAHELASQWYGGQWFPLYKLVCNGRILSASHASDCLGEIHSVIRALEKRQSPKLAIYSRQLKALGQWITIQGRELIAESKGRN